MQSYEKMASTKKKETFTKPGQKYKTPKKDDPLYRFYTSLHKQKPKSKMAIDWCISHGVFNTNKALRLTMETLKI